MSKYRLIPATAVAVLLATGGVATAATKPVVTKEQTRTATTAPVAIGSVKKGARLPKGDKIVFRKVTISKGQKASVTMTAPKGMTLQALAHSGTITWKAPKSLKGKRSVKLTVTSAKHAKGTVSGDVYALVR
ncbi:MAG TPA: hypothetical protein VH834_11815 [Solirubrobacteraceae bacterium]|jgi:hypothetical protein